MTSTDKILEITASPDPVETIMQMEKIRQINGELLCAVCNKAIDGEETVSIKRFMVKSTEEILTTFYHEECSSLSI